MCACAWALCFLQAHYISNFCRRLKIKHTASGSGDEQQWAPAESAPSKLHSGSALMHLPQLDGASRLSRGKGHHLPKMQLVVAESSGDGLQTRSTLASTQSPHSSPPNPNRQAPVPFNLNQLKFTHDVFHGTPPNHAGMRQRINVSQMMK